ncbi:uncharacterized protein METZ01_LOCUS361239 [marine metagenome]|uniref:YbaK/aminoacyl-tRNA synthetase-associated domain-containing protein n=1 Tax=marine metagenome TaxID=408172 RepID=A0A382SG06_9ZZZZ
MNDCKHNVNLLNKDVYDDISKLGIPYEIVECKEEYADTYLFCEKYEYPIEYCANTILLSSKKPPDYYVACVLQGNKKLDVNNKVRKLMNSSKVSFASHEETVSLTNMKSGGVTIFGLPKSIDVYVDSEIMNNPYLIFGSGNRNCKIKIEPNYLNQIPNIKSIENITK